MDLTPPTDAEPTPSLKDELRRPEAYASVARTQSVELIETHISWVFLLDHDVFKVKRPVRLSFLDFRSVEQRREACDAEVVLNRRLGHDVYRGVVPIRLSADGHALVEGSGPIVDHAVHMARLPDSTRADRLVAEGALGSIGVASIAARLASFHAACRSDATTARFGSPARIEANVEENFAETREVIEKYLRPDQADELLRWQRSFVRGHTSLFERRAKGGRVRDGHGDLRLEHVYLEDERVTVLDCIEFNERFRFGDACADVAFLSMDLANHGRVDLAEQLLAAYAREANDFDLYAVVDFYESYRAYVRAKLAAMLAEDEAVDDPTRSRAAGEARRYFLLALSADRRSMLLPAVVAVGGIIASGKSTIAERLGLEMSAPVVDADRTRKSMLGVAPTLPVDASAWAGAYDPTFTDAVYAEVIRRAGVVLASGRPVVIDASFRSPAMRSAARDLAMVHNVPFRFIECRAPLDACRARLVDRAQHRGVSDGRLAIFDDFCARFEPVGELAPTEHLVLDTTEPVENNLQTLRALLDVWPSGFVR